MRKIAVSISKGGTGKTTTAVNLAAGLARAGYKTLLVDTDTQGQVSLILGVQASAGLAEVAEGVLNPVDAVIETRPSLWLLSGGSGLTGMKRLITRKEFGGEHTIAEALAPLENQYDYVILDTAPGWDALTIATLFYATDLLCPVSLEAMALQGLVEFAKRIESIQSYRPGITLRYVLPTFYDRRVKKSDEILDQLKTHYGQRICPPIRYNVRLSEAAAHKQTIYEYNPKSAGAEDYQKLTERISQNGT